MYPIVSIYATLLAVIFLVVSIRTILARQSSGISLGSEGNTHLLRKIRVHGHFTEYVPFTLLLLLLAESNNAPSVILHICGSMLIAARILHAYGIDQQKEKLQFRIAAMVLSFTVIAMLAVFVLV